MSDSGFAVLIGGGVFCCLMLLHIRHGLVRAFDMIGEKLDRIEALLRDQRNAR